MDTILFFFVFIAIILAAFGGMALFVSRSFSQAQDRLLALTKERLSSEGQLARAELESRRDSIAQMIAEVRRDLTQSKEKLSQSEEQRIASFAALKQMLEQQGTVMQDLRGSTEDLKRVLSNNQLRGAFGEQVAENLLKMAGFVTGTDYVYNREQESADTRPDFTIFLPDKTKINVDVKFPFASLMKMSSAEDTAERESHKRQFATDVKQKIKQVTTRGYINPEERTVDFVILFIPNEMIFSFVYDQLHEVWEEAMAKKVMLAGPFSFTAILRMVKQAHSNFSYQENLHQVIGLIQKFEVEYEKFSGAIDTLGDRLESAKKQFDAVATTRSRQLTKVIDQIKSQNILSESGETEELPAGKN